MNTDIFKGLNGYYVNDLEDVELDDLAKVFSEITNLGETDFNYKTKKFDSWFFSYKGKTITVDKTKVKMHLVVEEVFEPTFWQSVNNPSIIATASDQDDHNYYAKLGSYKQVTVTPKP